MQNETAGSCESFIFRNGFPQMDFPGGPDAKSLCLQCGRPWFHPLGREDPLEKETAPHSSILAWKTPWTEKLGRLQSMESQRVRHIWLCMHNHTFMDIDNYIYELYITIQNLRAFILKRNGKKNIVNSKMRQDLGRSDAEAEMLILWPPDAKN